ncbi:MAG: protein kinase domain-containing protein [Pyrinomonadaceae bacterium]
MTPERWQKIEDLFQSARPRTPAERAAFLDGACGTDAELRAEIEGLLQAEDSAGSFINTSAVKVAAGMIADERVAEMQGRTVGHYKILSPLGAGGMGEVYLAADTRTGRRVALKVLPDYFGQDEQRASRFRQEAHAVLMLNHPNIVTVYDIGEADGAQYIASELVEGETLRRRLAASPLSMGEALEIAAQTAAALAAAHGAGVVHRDIKPENIMLRPDGYVKVLDFGIAKLTEQRPASVDTEAATRALVQTGPGVVMGTAHYMSPEQARGLAVDARTDIYSLGVVLYEMIAGRVPFEGATASDVIAAVLERPSPPLARYAPAAPAQAQWLVNKALRKERDERYQTVKEMLSDLRELKQELDAQAHLERSAAPTGERVSTGGMSAPPPAPAQPTAVAEVARTGEATQPNDTQPAAHTTSSAEYIATEIKRHKTGAVLALALLLVVLVGGGFALYKLLSQKSDAPPRAPKFVALTTGGRAADQTIDGLVTISPDGKYVTYAALDERQQSALWVKQVSTNNQVQLVPPAQCFYHGTTFSPDSEFVYYVKEERDSALKPTLYRVPVIGGASTKVLDNVWSTVGFSPDGRRFAFVRSAVSGQAIMLANTDGSGDPVVLATFKPPEEIPNQTAPSWSPDGKLIAFALRKFTGTIPFTVVGVSVADGKVTPLTSEQWFDMGRVLWLPDGSGLVFTAVPAMNALGTQVWFLSYPEGKARRITNDPNGYGGISLGLTADASTIATIQSRTTGQVWVLAPGEDESRAKQLTSGGVADGYDNLAWLPDGRIVYNVYTGEHLDLWIMNADGTGRKQLTNDAYWEYTAAASPDGRYMVFQSERGGNLSLWRIDADGNNPKQLTTGDGVDSRPAFSPDSQWIVFESTRAGKPTVWKVGIQGGTPHQLTDEFSLNPTVSPDGQLIAYGRLVEQPGQQPRPEIVLIPFGGGPAVKTLPVPGSSRPERGGFQWMPDGRAICFIDTIKNVPNIWALPVDGTPPKQLTNFTSDFIHNYAISRDGRQFAVSRGHEINDIVLIRDFR